MNETRPPQLYQVGDIVRVVDTPYESCPFSWVTEMNQLCGCVTKISRVTFAVAENCYEYLIEADEREFSWCENCFEPVEDDIKESDKDISVLFG